MCARWTARAGVSAGIAFAERISRVAPAEPYHAIFASMANANASRHRLQASKTRPSAGMAEEWRNIIEV